MGQVALCVPDFLLSTPSPPDIKSPVWIADVCVGFCAAGVITLLLFILIFGSQPVAVSKMQPGSGGLMLVPWKPINQAGYKLLMLL